MNVKKLWFETLGIIFQPIFRTHRSFLSRFIGLSAKFIYFKYENSNYDPYKNGEAWVLKELYKIGRLKRNLFDVGANNGDWAKMARLICGEDVTIHCFEIIPETFESLQNSLKNLKNIFLNNVGLSDKVEQTIVHFDPSHSGTSTIYNPMFFEKIGNETICKVIEGDDYVKDYKIEAIDYLKIDVEGMENLVLNGFKKCLSNKQIKVIQFEYGMVNIQSKFLLKDFYDFLTNYGYKIGKIYPEMVLFKEYEFYDENFIGPNYLAVHSECEDIFLKFGN